MNILNPQEYPLLDLVQVYKKALTKEQCSFVIKKTDEFHWLPHQWSGYNKLSEAPKSEENCDRTELFGMTRLLISGFVKNAIDEYKKYVIKTLGTNFNINGITIPEINRYREGKGMAEHVDHITSIFDGETKGIPTLSVVGLLNDEFQGGEFKFWDKYDMNLEIGDILVFPSNFLYKHQVDKVTRGIRYSFVSWIY